MADDTTPSDDGVREPASTTSQAPALDDDVEAVVPSTADGDSPAGATDATKETGEPNGEKSDMKSSTTPRGWLRSTPVVTVAAATILVLVGVVAVLGVGLSRANDRIDADAAADAAQEQAKRIAVDYATAASTIDYTNTAGWFDSLKQGTTQQLSAKFDSSRPQLERILVPLQWTSSATPVAAVVTDDSDGKYRVSVFLDVTSTSVQASEGIQTTVTYVLTVDSQADWQVTDVGGMESALPGN